MQDQAAESYYLGESAWTRGRNALAVLATAAWAASAYGWAANPRQFHASYLVAFMFFLTIALGATLFVAIQHLTTSAWSVTLRRLMENIMVTVPVAALLFVPIYAGIPVLYKWADPAFYSDDPVMAVKMAFFNPAFYLARTVAYFAVWTALAVILWRSSAAQDNGGSPEAARRAVWWSGPGAALLIVTVTMAAVDWLMSLEPHWYSTIFGVYVFSAGALAFVAALAAVCLALRGAGVLRRSIHVEHYHDLGKWLFALTVFWAYIAFSQYMLIWYANIPEETLWFKHRLEGNWRWVSALLLFGHFIVPFLVLLPRASKRNLALLGGVSVWMLVMHFVHLHWIVMPTVHQHSFHLHWLDTATWLAVGGVFALAFWYRLRRHPLVPVGDVQLQAALEFKNA